jgi:copper oxidase (laccase) domain-containing protein
VKNDVIKFADGKVAIGLSTVADGDMRLRDKSGDGLAKVRANITNFLHRTGFELESTTLVLLDYNREDFTQYQVADDTWSGKGMTTAAGAVPAADGLATTTRDLGLFLPLADCLGAVVYDPEHEALMVSHLGRHNLLQNGAASSVKYMTQQFGSKPEGLQIWLSPAGGKENFPVWALGNKGLRELALEQFAVASVNLTNITGDDIDTTTSPNYYSHSQALKTGQNLNKRFAIVAKIT